MDERLSKALEFGNFRRTLANQKKEIQSRMQVLMTLHYNNGSFTADPSFIGFVSALKHAGKTSVIVLDTRDNPIEISDIDDFLDMLIGAYTEASNEYRELILKLNKSRNIKQIMDWD